MDVLESSLKLYNWFSKKDSFCIEEDFIEIVILTETPERDKASMLCALDNLEKFEIVQSSKIKFGKTERAVWTLRKPLESLPQTIDIDYTLALMIAEILNGCAEKFNVKESMCDPSNVTPNNLRDLALLASPHLTPEEPLDNNSESS